MTAGIAQEAAGWAESIASALRTVATEQRGSPALADALSGDLAEPFASAVGIISSITGRVIVTGRVGKSGHIGSKLAATLASTARLPSSCIRPKPITAISA